MLDSFVEALHESNSRLWRYYDYVAATFGWPALFALLYFFWHLLAKIFSWPSIPDNLIKPLAGYIFLVLITTISIDRIRYMFTKNPKDRPVRLWYWSFKETFTFSGPKLDNSEINTNDNLQNSETPTEKDECSNREDMYGAKTSSTSQNSESVLTEENVRDRDSRYWRNYDKFSFLLYNGVLILLLSLLFWVTFAPKYNWPELPDWFLSVVLPLVLCWLVFYQRVLMAIDRIKYRLTGDPRDDPYGKWH